MEDSEAAALPLLGSMWLRGGSHDEWEGVSPMSLHSKALEPLEKAVAKREKMH